MSPPRVHFDSKVLLQRLAQGAQPIDLANEQRCDKLSDLGDVWPLLWVNSQEFAHDPAQKGRVVC